MRNQNSLSIVLPCYNERESVVALLDRLLAMRDRLRESAGLSQVEIIVVDDGSNDGSGAALAKLRGRIRIATHARRRGYGAALKTGFRLAEGEYIACFDLDGTYEALDLLPMLERLRSGNLGLVIGDRLHDIRNMPITRRIGNFLFRSLIRLLYSGVVNDSCSGQRLFHARHRDHFCDTLPNQLNFALAMTLLHLREQQPFAELPVRYYGRIGKSKLNVASDGIRFLATILRYRAQSGRAEAALWAAARSHYSENSWAKGVATE